MDSDLFRKILKCTALDKGFKIKDNMRRRKMLNFVYLKDIGFKDTISLIKFCGLKDELMAYIDHEYENAGDAEEIMTKYLKEGQ